MDRQKIKNTIAEVIHLTPARQAEVCYKVNIYDKDNEQIMVTLEPSLDYLTGTRIGSKDRKDLYESMIFHSGLALGNLVEWLDDSLIKYSVIRNFSNPPDTKSVNAVNILLNNIEFISYETCTWIEFQRFQNKGIFEKYQYDSTKCHRDLNFVINALCRDLEFLTNECISSVLMEYFDKDGNCLVRRDVEIAAYKFVKNLLNDVMHLKQPNTIYQAHVQQYRQGSIAEQEAVIWLNSLLDIITLVLENGISRLPVLVSSIPKNKDSIEVLINV